jgi:tRNA U34 2-thiouridine synthase MnmA/TrmU
MREFLLQRFPTKEGKIIYLKTPHQGTPTAPHLNETEPTIVGTHQGAYFYTIGQKHGLGLNFKAYIYRIDIENNLLYVTDKDSQELTSKELIAKDWHRILPRLGRENKKRAT